MDLFKPNKRDIDTRKRRHLFKMVKRVERISAVVLAWMVGATILYGVYTIIFTKPYFKVDTIEVKGNLKALNAERVIESSGIKVGNPLLHIPVADIQKKLVENPWIKEAAVHRKFPNMVWLYVNEYVPEAIVRIKGWYYVDRFGTLFKKLALGDEKDFPVITGLEYLADGGSGEDFKSRLVELLRVKKVYEASQVGEIYGLSEIHFDANKGVSIVTLNDPMELRLGFGSFAEKIDRLQLVYPAIRSHGGVVAYVDLGSEGKVVVKYGT